MMRKAPIPWWKQNCVLFFARCLPGWKTYTGRPETDGNESWLFWWNLYYERRWFRSKTVNYLGRVWRRIVFSPDGERIIWRHFNENGMLADIYTMKVDGTDVCRLTDFKSMSWAPYYHPSGEYVIFHSNKLGFTNCELFLVDTRGEKEPVRVTFTDRFDGLPVFSPDGKQLAWASDAPQMVILNYFLLPGTTNQQEKL